MPNDSPIPRERSQGPRDPQAVEVEASPYDAGGATNAWFGAGVYDLPPSAAASHGSVPPSGRFFAGAPGGGAHGGGGGGGGGPGTVPPDAGRAAGAGERGEPKLASCLWAMACHLGGLANFVQFPPGIGLIIPTVIWLALREGDPFLDRHGREAIHFQINVFLWRLLAWCLVIVLIGVPMLAALTVIEIVLGLMAAIAASAGRPFRYPAIVRLF